MQVSVDGGLQSWAYKPRIARSHQEVERDREWIRRYKPQALALSFQFPKLHVEFLLFFQPVVVFGDSPRRSSNRRDGCLVSRSFSLPLPSGVTFQLLFTHKSCGTQIALHTPGLGRVSWPGGWSWLSAHLLGGVGATYSSPGSFVFYSLTKVF